MLSHRSEHFYLNLPATIDFDNIDSIVDARLKQIFIGKVRRNEIVVDVKLESRSDLIIDYNKYPPIQAGIILTTKSIYYPKKYIIPAYLKEISRLEQNNITETTYIFKPYIDLIKTDLDASIYKIISDAVICLVDTKFLNKYDKSYIESLNINDIAILSVYCQQSGDSYDVMPVMCDIISKKIKPISAEIKDEITIDINPNGKIFELGGQTKTAKNGKYLIYPDGFKKTDNADIDFIDSREYIEKVIKNWDEVSQITDGLDLELK